MCCCNCNNQSNFYSRNTNLANANYNVNNRSNNCCNRGCCQGAPSFVAQGPVGPQGPIGPAGPQGPQGPQGDSGLGDGVYAVATTGTVPAGAIIPITLSASTTPTTLSVLGNSVNLPTSDTYLVSYSAGGSATTTDLSVGLYLNGVQIPNENIIVASEGVTSSSSKTILVTAPSGSTLSLHNTSTDAITLSSASITVLKLS